METVQKGEINFDRCIATPDMMPLVGRLGKILGPRGLMPNPKVGTVTNDVAQAVRDAKGGAVEFRVEKAGIVHAGVGKASFTDERACWRTSALSTDAVSRAKPSGAKGTYLKRIAVASTQGPGVRVDPGLALSELRPRRIPSGPVSPGATSSAQAQAQRAKAGRQVRLSGPVLSEIAGELRLLSP